MILVLNATKQTLIRIDNEKPATGSIMSRAELKQS